MVSTGPTRALFERTQVDYQNNLRSNLVAYAHLWLLLQPN